MRIRRSTCPAAAQKKVSASSRGEDAASETHARVSHRSGMYRIPASAEKGVFQQGGACDDEAPKAPHDRPHLCRRLQPGSSSGREEVDCKVAARQFSALDDRLNASGHSRVNPNRNTGPRLARRQSRRALLRQLGKNKIIRSASSRGRENTGGGLPPALIAGRRNEKRNTQRHGHPARGFLPSPEGADSSPKEVQRTTFARSRADRAPDQQRQSPRKPPALPWPITLRAGIGLKRADKQGVLYISVRYKRRKDLRAPSFQQEAAKNSTAKLPPGKRHEDVKNWASRRLPPPSRIGAFV